jgi:hypothetical protein
MDRSGEYESVVVARAGELRSVAGLSPVGSRAGPDEVVGPVSTNHPRWTTVRVLEPADDRSDLRS